MERSFVSISKIELLPGLDFIGLRIFETSIFGLELCVELLSHLLHQIEVLQGFVHLFFENGALDIDV